MKKLDLPSSIQEKIYDVKFNQNGASKITTYFPISDDEKFDILQNSDNASLNNIEFHSIFSDIISDAEWQKNKEQIHKKFRDDLFKID